MRVRFSFLVFVTASLLLSCNPHRIRKFDKPALELPLKFGNLSPTTNASEKEIQQLWWKEFKDPDLNNLIETAFSDNLNLRQAWQRLAQALGRATSTGSSRYPQLETQGTAARTRLINPEIRGAINADQSGTFYFNDFAIRNGLSFELDIWQRALNLARSADLEAQASQADLEQTALLLSGQVAETWFSLQELQELKKLLKQQIQTSKTSLELVELRFALGRTTALDVFQQRQQLAQTEAELPIVAAEYGRKQNHLAILVGQSPQAFSRLKPNKMPQTLPPFPSFISPAELVDLRPDLRAARSRLQGAEHSLASAIADRFPKLSIGLSYDFSASDVDKLFDRETGSMFSGLLLPLIDGGRRRGVVAERDARVNELIASFTEQYLEALREVEDALITERYQQELLEKLETQLKAAQRTFHESRSRYLNGLLDYLQVTVALQSFQRLERQIISERRALVSNRARLYRAIGGTWTSTIEMVLQSE